MSPSRDVRPVASRYRGGGYGRSRSDSSSYYDDEGRGASKNIWEWFKDYFEFDPTLEHLLAISDAQCYQLMTRSTSRFGLMDIAYYWEPGWRADQDTRAHKLVRQYRLTDADWKIFHKHLLDSYSRYKAAREMEEHKRAQEREGERAAYLLRQEAERIRIENEDRETVAQVIEMTAGTLSSELNQVFTSTNKIGNAGDWIEETVDTYADGSGFGYETDRATGIKLQVTLSLDLSNSMYYNGVHGIAAALFRDLGMSLKAMKAEYPDDLFVAFFTFGDDGWEGDGKQVVRLETPDYEDKDYFGEFRGFKPSVIQRWYREGVFNGTDTYFTPLFAKIEEWENEYSDSGAVKLDIVITDAVMEHKKDIKDSDVIQERRDGALQTVMLNFLRPEEAINSTLPKRSFQMFVDKDNVAGLLRQVISEFVGAQA